jgi:hypothetical protein
MEVVLSYLDSWGIIGKEKKLCGAKWCKIFLHPQYWCAYSIIVEAHPKFENMWDKIHGCIDFDINSAKNVSMMI